MFNIVILGLTSLFTDIASEMVYPILPFFLTATLGASPAILGIIEGIAESTASIIKVFSGYVSDRFRHRKGLAILGYAGSALGKLLLYAAGSWSVVLGARVIDRFGKGVRTAPRDALIAESAGKQGRGRAFGVHRAMDTLGAAVGVLVAYLFLSGGSTNYGGVFLWSLVPACIGVALLVLVREHRITTAPASLPSFRWSILPRKLKLFLVVALMFTLGNSSNTFLLLRSSGLGFSPRMALLLYLVYNLTYALSSYPAGRWSDTIGRKWLLVTGYAVYGMVYLGFGWATPEIGPWLVWILFGLYGIYSGVTDGIEKALVSDLAPAHARGTAIGLHATIVGAGLLPASILAGELWTAFGPAIPFYVGAGFGIVAAIALACVL